MDRDAIITQMDVAARHFVFPMLDNGYVYPADVRLTIYRDDTRWLMVIETLGADNPRTCGTDSFCNCLYLYGNALHRQPGINDTDFLYPIDSLSDDPLFADGNDWYAQPGARAIAIRGHRVALDLTAAALQSRGIVLVEPPHIGPAAVLRSLLPEHRDLLLASDEELAARNPHALPLFLRLDEWHHPDLASGELPGDSETFQMLAEAIATGDTSRYAPTRPPNTDWRNWPEGGAL